MAQQIGMVLAPEFVALGVWLAGCFWHVGQKRRPFLRLRKRGPADQQRKQQNKTNY
jgi:hypothetical protein